MAAATTTMSDWENVPELILIIVLSLLPVEDVLSCGRVCRRWNQLCHDDFLWKRLFVRDWLPSAWPVELRNPRTDTWESEYVRLSWHVPATEVQSIGLASIVTLIEFSHDGMDIATFSRDKFLTIYRLQGSKYELLQKMAVVEGFPHLIRCIHFSPNSTKLMVLFSDLILVYKRCGKGRRYVELTRAMFGTWSGCWASEKFFILPEERFSRGFFSLVLMGIADEVDKRETRSSPSAMYPAMYLGWLMFGLPSQVHHPHGMNGAFQQFSLVRSGSAKASGRSQSNDELTRMLVETNYPDCGLELEEAQSLAADCSLQSGMKLLILFCAHQGSSKLGIYSFDWNMIDDSLTNPVLPDHLIDLEVKARIFQLSPCQKYAFVPYYLDPSFTMMKITRIDLNTHCLAVQKFHVTMRDRESMHLQVSDDYLCHHRFKAFSGDGSSSIGIWDRHYSAFVIQLRNHNPITQFVFHPVDQEVGVLIDREAGVVFDQGSIRILWSKRKRADYRKREQGQTNEGNVGVEADTETMESGWRCSIL